MKKNFLFRTSCVDSTAELIDALEESEVEVSRQTFLNHVPRTEVSRVFEQHGFERGFVPPPEDNFVAYYRGTYHGELCYFFRWSAIEWIFTSRR